MLGQLEQNQASKMFTKVPSNEWAEHFEYVIEEDDLLSDLEDEPDFAEYLWMENEEEFDKNELQRLEEEDRINECMEAMLDDELEAELEAWEKAKTEALNMALSTLVVSDRDVENSKLNPLADEFVPQNQNFAISEAS